MSDTETNFDDFFGASAVTGGGEKTTYFKIKDGSNVYRIAPANRSLAASGKWWVRGDLHYGYTLPNERDPSKPFHKPFMCIQRKNFDTNMVTEECPECSLIEAKTRALQETIAARVAANVKQGMDQVTAEKEAEGSVKLMKRWFQDHNLDRKIYTLAKNEAGQWGVLPFRTAARKAVEEAFKKFEKQTGKSALDAHGGVWVDISRSGTGLSTIYSASVVMVPQADGALRFKDGGLTKADMQAIMALPDLSNIHDRNRLNYDQIKVLSDSENNPEVVAKVYGATSRAARTPAAAPLASFSAPAVPAAAPVPAVRPDPLPGTQYAPNGTLEPISAPAPVATAGVPDIAAMMAQIQALQAQLSAASAPVATTVSGNTTPAPTPKVEVKPVKDLSPEEFNKRFGNL